EKAVIVLNDALAIYKRYPLSPTYVYAKKALACSEFELGKKSEARKDLAEVESKGHKFQNIWEHTYLGFLFLAVYLTAAANLHLNECLITKKSAAWKEQLRNTTNPSELFSLLNNLIIVATYRKKWDFVHLYTEMSSQLNSKLL
ncbi:MAG: hypothetical protein K2X81_19570, partial [Candidatus Obscuribacterales bacterium]|nr:hypothetical protein [Candidatus Obscuribacterales bacterium]